MSTSSQRRGGEDRAIGDRPDPAREPPRTARGVRTRAALVRAARTVFERDGFLGARLTDITAEAACSTGTFYTYFTNKEEVFAAVLDEAQEEMLHPRMRDRPEGGVVAGIEASNRAYLEAYRRNAKLMRLLEQVANIDDEFRDRRRRRSDAFAQRNGRSIAALQAAGLVDERLDPLMAARALSGMVSRLAYASFVVGEDGAVDLEDLVFTLTRLWVNALRLEWPAEDPGPAPHAAGAASAPPG